MMFILHPFLEGVWRAYETDPTHSTSSGQAPDSTTNPETTSAQSGGSGQSASVFSGDWWAPIREHADKRFDSVNSEIGGIKEWIAKQSQATAEVTENVEEPVSQSEEPAETVLEVQDRQTVRNQRPRTNLNFGTMLRRLLQ